MTKYKQIPLVSSYMYMKDKRIQWINVHWNNGSVFQYLDGNNLHCEKMWTRTSSASGIMASRLSDKIQINLFIKFSTDKMVAILRQLIKVQFYYNVINAAQSVFGQSLL